MLTWPIDNANVIYIVLGFIILGLGVSWYLNRRVKTLAMMASVVVLGVVFWLLTLIVPTDRKQIQANLWAMAHAVVDAKPDDLAKHWAKEFRFQNLGRDELAKAIIKRSREFGVVGIHLWDFDVKSVGDDRAEIWFRCRVDLRAERPFPLFCKAEFTKAGDFWLLQRVRFFEFTNANQEFIMPL